MGGWLSVWAGGYILMVQQKETPPNSLYNNNNTYLINHWQRIHKQTTGKKDVLAAWFEFVLVFSTKPTCFDCHAKAIVCFASTTNCTKKNLIVRGWIEVKGGIY